MQRIEFILAPTRRSADYEATADHIVDTFPAQQWLWDHSGSDDARHFWIFYADDAQAVRIFVDGVGREWGFAVQDWQVSEVALADQTPIRRRLA